MGWSTIEKKSVSLSITRMLLLDSTGRMSECSTIRLVIQFVYWYNPEIPVDFSKASPGDRSSDNVSVIKPKTKDPNQADPPKINQAVGANAEDSASSTRLRLVCQSWTKAFALAVPQFKPKRTCSRTCSWIQYVTPVQTQKPGHKPSKVFKVGKLVLHLSISILVDGEFISTIIRYNGIHL